MTDDDIGRDFAAFGPFLHLGDARPAARDDAGREAVDFSTKLIFRFDGEKQQPGLQVAERSNADAEEARCAMRPSPKNLLR
jgi:hypothetical protein